MAVCFCVFPFFSLFRVVWRGAGQERSCYAALCTGCYVTQGLGWSKDIHVTLCMYVLLRHAWGGVGWGHNFHAALLMYVQTIDRVCVWLNLKSWLPPKLQAVKVSILWVNSGCVVKVVCLALPKRWWHTLWDCWKSTTDERLPLKKEVVYGCLRQFKSNKDVCFPQ